jgi:PII-like signaling protein
MQGYQLTFFTQQDRNHRGQPLAEWLLTVAHELRIKGATIVSASEGYGRHGRIHAARFFELGDQPQEVIMVVDEAEAQQFFDLLGIEDVQIFYVKAPVEFGLTGRR